MFSNVVHIVIMIIIYIIRTW